MTVDRDRSQHLRPVGKEKSIADIKKNYAPVCHVSILMKASGNGGWDL
jgi:hypothetical protein